MKMVSDPAVPVDLLATQKMREKSVLAQPAAAPQPQESTSDWYSRIAARLEQRLERRVYFQTIPFVAGVASALILPQQDRYYLFIQNNGLTIGTVFVSFAQPVVLPTLLNAGNAIAMNNGGFYEPLWIPQDEIYVAGSVANLTGTILMATSRGLNPQLP